MGRLCFAVLVITMYLSFTSGSTCEETETSHVKLDLAKESIYKAKQFFPKCGDDTSNKTNCSVKDRSLAYLNAALDLISEAKILCQNCPETKVIELPKRPVDCTDVLAIGYNKSGVYTVWPREHGFISNKSIEVYCDMATEGGGWTVIQRRGDFGKKISFYQDWETYKKGFGNNLKEFWLGNDNIFLLTNQGSYSARFDLVDVKGEYRYAAYGGFIIGDESSAYVLRMQNYRGNATDALRTDNGSKFSTKDRQNENRRWDDACADMYRSAFWFHDNCGSANVNGVYLPGVDNKTSVWWHSWKGNCEGLHSVEIKIRRNNP